MVDVCVCAHGPHMCVCVCVCMHDLSGYRGPSVLALQLLTHNSSFCFSIVPTCQCVCVSEEKIGCLPFQQFAITFDLEGCR